MALVRTQLAAPIGPGELFWNLVSTVGFPVIGAAPIGNGQPVQVDNELAFHVSTLTGTLIKVRSRGSDGTVAVAHDINAPVVTSSTFSADFPVIPPGQSVVHPPTGLDQTSYGSDSAILSPTRDAKAFLTKTSAGAYTLGAPSLANNGIELVISSATAFAHALTTVALLATGTAGSPFSVATFPAVAGATLFLEAQNGLWNVVATNGAIAFT